jgi:hypothetical protein
MLRHNDLGIGYLQCCTVPSGAMHGHSLDEQCCPQRCCGFVLTTEVDMQQEWHVPIEAKPVVIYSHMGINEISKSTTIHHAQTVNDCVLPCSDGRRPLTPAYFWHAWLRACTSC